MANNDKRKLICYSLFWVILLSKQSLSAQSYPYRLKIPYRIEIYIENVMNNEYTKMLPKRRTFVYSTVTPSSIQKNNHIGGHFEDDSAWDFMDEIQEARLMA